MDRIGIFLRDSRGAVTIGSIGIAAAGLCISAVVALAISNGGQMAPQADNGAPASAALLGELELTRTVTLPVGSVVVHSDGAFTSFRLPDGGWLDAWSGDGTAIPEGSILNSPSTFALKDGGSVDANKFASAVSEAYSSKVKYAFK